VAGGGVDYNFFFWENKKLENGSRKKKIKTWKDFFRNPSQ